MKVGPRLRLKTSLDHFLMPKNQLASLCSALMKKELLLVKMCACKTKRLEKSYSNRLLLETKTIFSKTNISKFKTSLIFQFNTENILGPVLRPAVLAQANVIPEQAVVNHNADATLISLDRDRPVFCTFTQKCPKLCIHESKHSKNTRRMGLSLKFCTFSEKSAKPLHPKIL